MAKREKEHLGIDLIKYSLPLIFSGLLQQLYNCADALIVGNVNGELELAAIGCSSVIISLFILAIVGFTSGISILVAHRWGEKNEESERHIFFSFLFIITLIAIILSAISIIFTNPLLVMMGTPINLLKIARHYQMIILLGIPFIAVYNVYASVLRGIGDSKVSFYAVLFSSLLNVSLDLLFVAVFNWGALGAAIASVISQFAMAIYIIIYTYKKYKIFRLNGHSIKSLIDIKELRDGTKLALPITIQSMINGFGSLFLQGIMNSLGSSTVAAITSAYRIDSVIMLPIVNAGTAVSIFTSRSIGEGNKDKAFRCLKVGSKMNLAFSLFLVIITYFLGGPLVSLFGLTEESLVIGANFFKCLSFFYILFGLSMTFRGYIEGMGHVIYSGLFGILSLCVRIVFSYLLLPIFDNMVIAFAEGFSWCFMFVSYLFGILIYRHKFLEKNV